MCDELVHHLQRAGDNARRDDVADGLTGVFHALEHAEHRFIGLRRFDKPHQHLRDDAEHPFAADDRAAQIVALHLLAAVGFRAEPNDLAVGQHHFETEHVVGGDAVFERVRSAGIGGHIAADGAGGLAGRIGRIEQPL